jgi:hypothetical protein
MRAAALGPELPRAYLSLKSASNNARRKADRQFSAENPARLLGAHPGHCAVLDIFPEADEVDGSRSRHLSAKLGRCQANPSKGAIRHANYHHRP